MSKSRDLSADESVVSLVSEFARTSPTATAVVCGERSLTYADLDAAASRLAGYLVAHGVRPGDLVGVCLARSVDLVVGVLAVLRAGATCVALDPTGPERPLREAVRRLDPAFLVTRERFRVRLADVNAAGIRCIDTDAAAIAASDMSTAPPAPGGSGPACVVHTGTRTVRFDHRDLARVHRDWAETFGLDATDRVLVTAPVDSARFTTDWVRALCSGGTLEITERDFPPHRTAHLRELATLAERATVMDCDTLLARRLLGSLARRRLPRLRLFVVSGERWYVDEHRAAREVLGAGVRVVHAYRTAAVLGDVCRMEWGNPTIPAGSLGDETRYCVVGRAVDGVRVTLVDRTGRSVGPNRVGEILVSVDGRDIHTGDLGRRRSGHPLGRWVEYVGGTDRGFGKLSAVAVATIEADLRAFPGVWEAVVVPAPAPERSPRAVVYVVPKPGNPVDISRVKRWYEGRYSRPRAVVRVPSVPRTRSGEIDVDGLPTLPGEERPRRLVGKGGGDLAEMDMPDRFLVMLGVAGVVGLIAYFLTGAFWPGSTDTSLVPLPWAALFHVLYVVEAAAFGLGVGYLFLGYPWLASHGRGVGLTVVTHLSLAWLLLSWWPQDNFYRLAAKTDYPRQAALVYGFNITLIIAGLIVVLFVFSATRDPDDEPRRSPSSW